MTAAKIAVSIPQDLLALAKRVVRAGKSPSLSALVTAAVSEKIERDTLTQILDQMDLTHGKPTKEATAWAKSVLKK
jgi:metal-responsive CopG/Arc/MetJ family transcriptional regulator